MRCLTGDLECSVAGREIAVFGIHGERWKSLRRPQLDFDLPPFSVMCAVARLISDNILIAQLHADFRRDVGQYRSDSER